MKHHLPYQLLASLEHVKGFDQLEFEAVHLSEDKLTSIRINPDKIETVDPLGYETMPILWCKNGYYLSERPIFTFNPLIHAGAFYVQEASSMFLLHIIENLAIPSNSKVLDLCGAPGGKSTLLSTYFKDGIVVCNDVIQSRAAILVENTVKWSNDNTIVTNNDPRQFAECTELFDVIVVDAPCSGSGLFRKDNEAIGEWSLDNVQHCAQRQQRILLDILPCLKNEGVIIYSTCSYSKEEDEEIVDFILEQNPSLVSVSVAIKEDWNIVETISDQHQGSGYRFFPDKVKGEGFFIAAFRKTNSISKVSDKPLKADRNVAVTKSEIEIVNNFIPIPDSYEFIKNRDSILALPAQHIDFIRLIISKLYIKRVGIELGEIKHKDFIPSHHLAMSELSKGFINKTGVEKEIALNFLRKKEIDIIAPKGWNIVQYNNISLGWIKVLPNRINNYYPTEWRIIKS